MSGAPGEVDPVRPEGEGSPAAVPHVAAAGPGFWLAAAVGAGFVAFGVHTALASQQHVRLGVVVTWLLGLLVLHDAVVTLVVGGSGWALTRWLPGWVSGPVRAALGSSVLVVVFSTPLWRRYGADPTNPSRLPLHYGTAVLTVVGVIWLVAAVAAGWRWRTRPRLP